MNEDRKTGLAAEADYIARTGNVVSSPKEFRARTSWEGGMSFATLCVRYDFRPETALKVLGLTREHIHQAEWARAEIDYAQTKDLVRNDVRGERLTQQRTRDIMSNPMRGRQA